MKRGAEQHRPLIIGVLAVVAIATTLVGCSKSAPKDDATAPNKTTPSGPATSNIHPSLPPEVQVGPPPAPK